jgi:antitoxin (DNA-binding transcriptional repressor) of toxin-antitoxin stability system
MSTVSVQDLQRDLLTVLRRVETGESFLIVRDGQPLAEVRPAIPAGSEPRPFGLCAGQFTVPPDFDQPLPDDFLKDFEGS